MVTGLVSQVACCYLQRNVPESPSPNMPNQFSDARAFWSAYAVALYSMPRAWAHRGENLFHAFEAVAAASEPGSKHLNMNDQALMLAGMSIEVQLKAILVSVTAVRDVVTAAKRPNTTDVSSFVVWQVFYSHNLPKLAELAQVDLDREQLLTATALSQYIYWRGRYVVPTERGIDDLIPVELDTGLVGQAHFGATVDSARNLIHHIIQAVKTRLYVEA